MQHFVSLQDLTRQELENLLDAAEQRSTTPLAQQSATLQGISIASLFYEPSTRTRVSFELAAKHLGAHFVDINPALSSNVKGETVWDTVATLQAMGISQFIVRTAQAGLPRQLAQKVASGVSVINAGEADIAHPSQGLLDLMTVRQLKGDLDKLSIAIVGDIAHSRVARSFYAGAMLLGCKDIRLIAPDAWQVSPEHFPSATLSDSLIPAIEDVDIIMALRIQRERLDSGEIPDIETYRARYSITEERLQRAHPDTLVMHPGPMNRNVEISDAVADGPQSVIFRQVRAGVPARMAILSAVSGH